MKMRGAISFVFDDGYQSVLQTVVPLLDRYQIPGVFALPLDESRVPSTERRPTLPWSAWRERLHSRHEIAAHSITHVDLTTLSAGELQQELKEPQQTLEASTLIYPGGAHNDNVVRAAQHYYRGARTVLPGFESLPPQDPWQLKTYNFTRHNFSPRRANLLALWAYLTNRWLIETYHIVDNNETEKVHAVKLNDFVKHLRFVQRLPLRAVTIREIITSPTV